MLRLVTRIPKQCAVAVSGGADSLALLDFVARSGREVTALHYDHGTGSTLAALPYIRAVCDRYGVELRVSAACGARPRCTSSEAWWRSQRYLWLSQQHGVILTAHTLNDGAETWLWGAANGQPKLIQAEIQWGAARVLRPWLAVSRREIEHYCAAHAIKYWQDPANTDTKYTRVRVREQLVPAAEQANPGFLTVMRRKVLTQAAQTV
jgi:tRNA(Ile)-lysidine synthase